MLTYEYLHTVLNTEKYECTEVNGCNIYKTSFHGWPFAVAIENENYILVMAADSCSELFPEFKNTSLISVGKDGIAATWDTLEMSVVVALNSSEFEPLEKEEWVKGVISKEKAENFAFPNLLYLGPQMYQLPLTGNKSVKGVPVKREESQVKLNLTGKRFYGFPMINGAIYWMPILSRSTN